MYEPAKNKWRMIILIHCGVSSAAPLRGKTLSYGTGGGRGTSDIKMSWETTNRRTQSRASEAEGRELGSSEHILLNKSTSGWEKWPRCWERKLACDGEEVFFLTHTPNLKVNIVPNCQMSARKGQYGVSDNISGAGILPYSPVRIPVVGRPVTVRDDGSECGSNVTANSKSLM